MAPVRAHGVPLFAVPLAALLLLTGCSAAPGGTPFGPVPTGASTAPAGSASGADVESAAALLKAVTLADAETIAAIDEVRFTPAALDAARNVLATGASGDALWAATWVYASSGTDSAVLTPLLVNGDASIRVMAAAALVAAGDRSGFPILGASLSEKGQLRGSQPPISTARFGASTLFAYIEAAGLPAEAATAAELDAITASWSAWLGEHEKSLQFDTASGTWKLG